MTLDSPPGDVLDYVRRRQAQDNPPDGHVCVGEVAAMATLAALTDCGRRAGDGVYLAAKRASPVFELYRPQIAAQFEDVRDVGRLLGDLLLRRISGEPAEKLQIVQAPLCSFKPPAI